MIGYTKYKLSVSGDDYYQALLDTASRTKYPHITNPCVTKDTWILTDCGPKLVNELIGKKFVAIINNEKYSSDEKGFWSTGIKKVYEITTDRGYKIKLTDNHKLLKELKRRPKFGGSGNGYNFDREYVEVKDLNIGDKLVLHNHRGNSWNGEGSFVEGWLLGQIVGDGGYNPDKYPTYLRFWGLDRESLAQYAIDICKEIFSDLRSDFDLRSDSVNSTIDVATNKLDRICNNLIEPHSKNFLPKLEQMSSKFIRGFIRGFSDADGTVSFNSLKGSSIRLAQSDLSKLETVQRMLARLGIISTIFKFRRNEREVLLPNGKGGLSLYNTKAQHELVISKNNIEIFENLIGFADLEKEEKLSLIIESRNKKTYQESFLTKIESIELVSEEEVYDCTINEVHCFDANGFVSHNCGEITLHVKGGYCLIGDMVPYFCEGRQDVIKVGKAAVRFLMRTNLMDCLYKNETKRTMRIGVGLTGIHEFAWEEFGYGFRDLINEEVSQDFWDFIAEVREACEYEAERYALELGVNVPHTVTTIKPSGSVSKLYALTEGAHLPAMRYYLRWVQLQNNDPNLSMYKEKGYPWFESKMYPNVSVVGFPTMPLISKLGMGDKLVTANEATPEEQYQWLRLLEKYWLGEGNNQISYTLKFDPNKVPYEEYKQMILNHQGDIRCCAVLPTKDPAEVKSRYEYLPEEEVSEDRFMEIINNINDPEMVQALDLSTLLCAGGACPL